MSTRRPLAFERIMIALSLMAGPLVWAQSEATFDLPPQPLADSLLAVARATHTNIVFDADIVAGIRAPALKGTDTAEQALTSLLAHSGLQYARVDVHTIRVARITGREGSTRQDGPARLSRDASEALSIGEGQGAEAQGSGGTQGGGEAQGGKRAQRGGEVQDGTEAERAERGAPVELAEVVVTGSHIHGASTPSPTITITRQEIDRSGYTDVGDVIRILPQDFSGGNTPQIALGNTPSQNSANFSGGTSPNLRGLGPESTLTLVNGHRLGQDGPLGAVDISLIPLSAIERIEVVTDSSSAAYGSDAVAGVVNFILRKDYEGAETSGSLGTATEGGGYERDINQLLGHSWGSGGALLVYEHQRQDAVWANQRDFTATAAMPSTLLPEASRDSGFLSIHQDVGSAVSIVADGLYTSRTSDFSLAYPPSIFAETITSDYEVKQYFADLGVTGKVGHDWTVTAYGSFAAERNVGTYYQFASPMQAGTLFNQELLRGGTRTAEAIADGPIWELGRGAIRAAIGGGYREEDLDVAVTVSGTTALYAKRGARYAFAEVDVPIESLLSMNGFHAFDLNFSARYEGYTDSIGKAVPKVGLLIAPVPALSFRTTWSEAFRAPTLYSLYDSPEVYLVTLSDPLSSTGSSQDLVRVGGNPQLRPETAKSWTAGFEWSPQWMEGGEAQLSYFDIRYHDRVQSLDNYRTALIDPEYAPLVTRDPPVMLQESIISEVNGAFYNLSGRPYVPTTVAALIDARSLNIANQHLSGVDLLARYKRDSRIGALEAFANASYLQFRERITPASPEVELAGVTFNPPRFRARGGMTWTIHGLATTGIVNWIDHSVNTYVPGSPVTGSWTTFDVQLSYKTPPGGLLSGLRATLSVQNLLDRDPPFAQYLASPVIVGFNYDSNNFNPMGRYVTLQISKQWIPTAERN